MAEKKTPIKPTTTPATRRGNFEGAKVQKSFTTNNVPSKIGKPKPSGEK